MTAQIELPIRHEIHEEEQDVEYDGIKVIQEFMLSHDIGESPINVNLTTTIPISLPPLLWHHHDLPPKKMKCTNTGHTLIMSAKWNQERPYISGGPLFGNYVFSQLHFHWGKDNMEGSEHTIDGSAQPLEMHVVLFKSCYLTQEAALKKRDGIMVVVYFFKLQAADNIAMELITDAIPYVQMPHSSARLDPLPLSFLPHSFAGDYFMYWGTVTTAECVHILLWVISREPIGISVNQMDIFRTLLNIEEEPLRGNFRPTQDFDGNRRTVFHANPSTSLYSTLLPIRRNHDNLVKKTGAKPETERDMRDSEVFRMEPQYENPFKDEKKETSKYTISTSIKVDPDLLQRLKSPKTFNKAEHSSDGVREVYNQSRNAADPCLESTSIDSSGYSRQSSSTFDGNTETRNDAESKQCNAAKKPSLIPRRIPKKQ